MSPHVWSSASELRHNQSKNNIKTFTLCSTYFATWVKKKKKLIIRLHSVDGTTGGTGTSFGVSQQLE